MDPITGLRAFFDAVADRNFAAMRELLAPDFVWHVSGPQRFAGDYRGFDKWLEYVAMLQQEVGATMRMSPYEFLANDRYAVALLEVYREREGRPHTNKAVQVCRFEDGLIAEVWFLDTDPAQIEAFYS
jgi:ketosteroid isomerase-like protein